MHLYKDNGWTKGKAAWVYDKGANTWRKAKALWVYQNGKWSKDKTFIRTISNFKFTVLKSESTMYPGGEYNNIGSVRAGVWSGYNYQGFMFGRPSKADDGLDIGTINEVTKVKIKFHRADGGDSSKREWIGCAPSTWIDPNTGPTTIPTYVKMSKIPNFQQCAIGEWSVMETSNSDWCEVMKYWLNNYYTSLSIFDPDKSSGAYSVWDQVIIERIEFN